MKRFIMKRLNYHIAIVTCIIGITICFTSCKEDLLDQVPGGEVASVLFWQTEADAEYALHGAYSATRDIFAKDWMFDGNGEYFMCRSTSSATQSTNRPGDVAYRSGNFTNPASYGNYNNYFQYAYAAVNHTNYVIQNVEAMLPNVRSEESRSNLEAIIGEARMLRGMTYFRLITMWGDVPYFDKIVNSNDEVANITRTPIADIKESIMNDFTYAWENCHDKPASLGRFTKWGALAFRGKLQLYWASWNRTSWPWDTPVSLGEGGWPELDTFTPNSAESAESYAAAAADLKRVIQESGISLFRNGEPGDWGEMGESDILPNYYHLFIPTANADPEIMVGFTHGGIGTGQGDELMRNFGSRSTEGSQGFALPRYEIADRYQSTVTGDFVAPLIPLNPSVSDARTRENSALNPESYRDRDYRMKSTILWDGETMPGILNLSFDQERRFRYKTNSGTIDGLGALNADAARTGYIMRKFMRNYAGQGRSDGDYHWPVIRLADVYLLYAEAANEAYGPTGDGGLALEVVNKVRHRGNLPALQPDKYSDKLTFFYAIEQERIVELYAEGHRMFDLRRWRSIERAFLPPQTSPGVRFLDSHGAIQSTYFNNTSLLTYQRMYLFRIPESERNRNPNLTQNTPWL